MLGCYQFCNFILAADFIRFECLDLLHVSIHIQVVCKWIYVIDEELVIPR